MFIMINKTLNFTEQANSLYNRAKQRLGLFIKRTCHFVTDQNKRILLYLPMVRSIFEHCHIIWRLSSKTIVNTLESIQKKALEMDKTNTYLSVIVFMAPSIILIVNS